MTEKNNHEPLIREAHRQIETHLQYYRTLYDSRTHKSIGTAAFMGLGALLKVYVPQELRIWLKEEKL